MLDPLSHVLVATALAAPLAAQSPPEPSSLEPARALFVANCATCHGETGDGKGTTQLDRPARSFMDGGFSFGNTPDALFRTISVGIPGTPMPGFESSLSDEQRKLLADFVVTLGPPVEVTEVEDTILAVRDRPVIVRGLLPELADGLPRHPRGLLIGDPSGITFEYTTDDVRLLALRQGDFVERTDWNGRGGTPLKPLGKVVQLEQNGAPGPLFSLAAGAIPLEAHLSSTRIDGEKAVIEYHLLGRGREVAHVAETPYVLALPEGTGFGRHFQVTNGDRSVHLAIQDPTQAPGARPIGSDITFDFAVVTTSESDASKSLQAITTDAKRWSRMQRVLIVDLEPGQRCIIDVGTIPTLAERPTR